jgi:hypothetical protein
LFECRLLAKLESSRRKEGDGRRRVIMEVDLEWHDEYSIGVDEIDVQHERFLNCNTLAV